MITISTDTWLNMGEHVISRLVQDSIWVSLSDFFLAAVGLLGGVIGGAGTGLWNQV